MKRKLILFAILSILSACQSDNEKISKIFEESVISIEMNTCSCYGCSESELNFYKNLTKVDLVSVTGTEISNPKKIEKEDLTSIKNLFLDFKECSLKGCTNSTEFKIKGKNLEVLLFEDGCTLKSSIFSILE